MRGPQVLRFAVFELDQSGELRKHGRRVPLPYQAFTMLWMLASRAGQTVSRDDLRRALWAEGTHVDFDRGLNFCAATIRRALGDRARRPRFVETLPKRGYRFIADVHIVDVDAGHGGVPRGFVLFEPPSQLPAHPPPAPGPVRRPVVVETTRARWSRVRRWAVAAVIPVLLSSNTTTRVHTRLTTSPEALAAFDRGDYDRAVALDSRFAEAYYAQADRFNALGERRAMPQRVAFEHARVAALHAVSLERMPESLSLAGRMRLMADGDVAGAVRDTAAAVALAPGWDIGLAAYADVLSAAGDDARARDAIARAQALSPGCDLIARQSAILRFRARDFAGARRSLALAESLAGDRDVIDPEWRAGLRELALRIAAADARWDDARREAVAIAQLNGASTFASRLSTGRADDAVRAFFDTRAGTSARLAAAGRLPPSSAAIDAALAGLSDSALDWLARARAERDPELLFALRDPAFDLIRLRTDPRPDRTTFPSHPE